MYRKVYTLITLVVALVAAAPSSANAAPSACAGLDDYQMAIIDAIPREDALALFEQLDEDLQYWRPSEFREASRILDDWATALDDMPTSEIPRSARDYHAALIDSFSVMSAAFNAAVTGGVFGLMAYTEAMEDTSAALDAANRSGVRQCGATVWPFEDTTDGGTL